MDAKRKSPSRTAKVPKTIYRLKVTLKDVKPPVWRRFEVTSDITLIQLHQVVQSVMGWTNSHLHQFDIEGSIYTYPDEDMNPADIDERAVRLDRIVCKVGAHFRYDYDFGDGWEHQIRVEQIEPARRRVVYPRCLEGARCCPPEDCGGPWGYEDFLKALADPRHERHEELTEWIGGDWDPERFSLRDTNSWLREVSSQQYYLKNRQTPY